MAYRPFFEVEPEDTPATFANPATFRKEKPQSVADVATVADPLSPRGQERPAPEIDPAELQYRYEERAAILEYDCGLSREEAEQLARLQISKTNH